MYTARWPADGLIEMAGVPIVVCVVNGRVDYQVGENVIHCGEGYFILVPPGAPHDDGSRPHYKPNPQLSSGDHCELLWFNRYGRNLLCWMCHCAGDQHGVRPGWQHLVVNDAANQLLDLLFEEAENLQAGWEDICQDYLQTFLKVIRREVKDNKEYQGELISDVEAHIKPRQNRIEEARQYIRTHLRLPLTIEKVARHVYMSRTQFTQSFRRQTGQSFSEFLTQCRLEEARMLLQESDWSVTRISKKVGLKSLPHFCSQFRRYVGVTPQEFRNQARAPLPAKLSVKK
jgi:AraC-like DNA-binding protein